MVSPSPEWRAGISTHVDVGCGDARRLRVATLPAYKPSSAGVTSSRRKATTSAEGGILAGVMVIEGRARDHHTQQITATLTCSGVNLHASHEAERISMSCTNATVFSASRLCHPGSQVHDAPSFPGSVGL